MSSKIAIIGAGEMGQALTILLQQKNYQINLWDLDKTKVPNQKSLPDTVKDSDFLFLCIPAAATRPALQNNPPPSPPKNQSHHRRQSHRSHLSQNHGSGPRRSPTR